MGNAHRHRRRRDDDDIIENNGAHALIDGRGGNDSINTTGDNVTVTGGEGTNTITTYDYQPGVIFRVGQGNDLIDGFNASSTIQVVQGSLDTVIANNGSDLLLSVDDKVITLASAALLDWVNVIDSDGELVTVNIQKTVNIGDAPKQITNIASGTTIVGGNGNDSIENKIYDKWGLTYHPDNVLILGNGGRDSIKNDQGRNITISGGDGNDFIDVTGNDISINAGEGNDFVHDINWYTGSWTNWTVDLGNGDDFLEIGNVSKSTIRGGADDDIINNSGADVTITGGTGNDKINNYYDRENLVYVYSGGSDTIDGFNATSTLQIGDGTDTYRIRKGDSDVTIMAGDGSIVLWSAAELATLNIIGEEFEEPEWTLTDSIATFGTPTKTLVTVTGLKSVDGLSISGEVVTLSKAGRLRGNHNQRRLHVGFG